jgi:integrase
MPRKTNVAINGKDYYRVRATVGKNSDGSEIRKAFYGSSRKEAEEKRDEYLTSIKRGLNVGFDKVTFADSFNAWFDDIHSRKLQLSSRRRYLIDIEHRIKPSEFMTMKLSEIKSFHVQKHYNKLFDNDTSADSIKNTHKLLRAFFGYCEAQDFIEKSPLRKGAVTLPERKEIKEDKKEFLAELDIEKVFENARTNPDNFIFVFLIFSGLRIGEASALTFKDINLDTNMISVNKSVGYLTLDGEYKPVVSATKTEKSIREIPISSEIRGLLKRHMKLEQEKYAKLGIPPFSKNNILFSASTGTYLNGRNVRRSWERLCKRLEIEETTLHALRHTFCSLLAANGVSIQAASELMGHSNIKITQQVYTHIRTEEKIRAVDSIVIRRKQAQAIF